MVLIGKAYGTKDPLFINLFIEDKAYLMGKLLTVESRIKSFKDSVMPSLVYVYYNEKAYQKMLITLSEMLIQNNEHAMFT